MVFNQILKSCKQKHQKNRNVDKELAKKNNFKKSNIFINLFGYEDETPYRIDS